jgi:hypothetical protein
LPDPFYTQQLDALFRHKVLHRLVALDKSILVHLKLWHLPARPPPGGMAFSNTIADYGFFDGLVS